MIKLEELSEELSKLSIIEAVDLLKILEKKWNIKASILSSSISEKSSSDKSNDNIEKTEFDLELTEIGSKKIRVIKVVRELTGLGLKEAKEMVDSAPKVIKSSVTKEEAKLMQRKIEEQGAKVSIK